MLLRYHFDTLGNSTKLLVQHAVNDSDRYQQDASMNSTKLSIHM